MRIHFNERQQAVRFATAVVNVTGREPAIARTTTPSWLVQTADLNDELACAIFTLLERGTPCHQVTLDQVAEQVEAERQAQAWAQSGREPRRPAAILPLLPLASSTLRVRRPAAAVG